jgi:hypothetical protein
MDQRRRGVASWLAAGTLVAGVAVVGTLSSPASAIVPGARWASIQAPVPGSPASPNPTFKATACPSPDNCEAAGSFSTALTDEGTRQGVLDVQSSGIWSAIQAPLPPNAAENPGVAFTAMDCAQVGACAAVGSFTDSNDNDQGLLEAQSGTSWSGTEAPLPASPAPADNPRVSIVGVACTGPGSCVAVGDYVSSSGTSVGLIETLAAGRWTQMVAPMPPTASESFLQDVACPAATSCIAVGGYTQAAGPQQGVIETMTPAGGLDGSFEWTPQTAPVPPDADPTLGSSLTTLSCPSGTGFCQAVGIYDYYFERGGPDHGRGLIDTLSSGTWTPTGAPVPSDAAQDPGVRLNAVSCSSPSFCALAGTYEDTDLNSVGLLGSYNGASWQAAVGVSLDDTPASPAGVACPADGTCIAAGGTDFNAQIWTLAGGHWQAATAPLPPGARGSGYPGPALLPPDPVSCAAGAYCMLAGSYPATDGTGHGFIDTLDVPPTQDTYGYWLSGRDGGVFSFGRSVFYGSSAPSPAPTVSIAPTANTAGYLQVTSTGGLSAFGSGENAGDMVGQPLNAPMVGVAAHPSGDGYWLVASDGGVFAFSQADFYGSMGGRPLNKPVVGMASTPDGRGYWLVASDGGVFAFGDAQFYGSMGGKPLNRPIVGMDPTPDGQGYWLVASDGGVFAFGDAHFDGSMGGRPLNQPVTGMAAVPDGQGYWLVASDGGVFAFGDAPFLGSMGGKALAAPVTSIAGI